MPAPKAGAEAFALVSYFEKKYKEKYGRKPVVNRYAARWGFDAVLAQMPSSDAESLIDYYFHTENPQSHTLDWFLYNYHKLLEAKVEYDKDRADLKRRAEESRRRTEEWRRKIAERTEGS